MVYKEQECMLIPEGNGGKPNVSLMWLEVVIKSYKNGLTEGI